VAGFIVKREMKKESVKYMKHVKFLTNSAAVAVITVLCSRAVLAQTQAPPAVPSEELPAGTEVLARGPVHEAFAKPVTMDPQAPIIVPAQPPAPLQEIPPAEKPAGAGIVWVPGYWAWDADRNDFIWLSGCWRNAPPGTYWVPGHWLEAGGGWEWVAGFWQPLAAQGQQQIEYLPAPPAAVEVEAVGAPPMPDQIWVPGCWYWTGGRYVVRHGYWMAPHAGWVWVPSHYAWTPRGYIFCPGHWDYALDDRGVLFTPAYFPPAVRVQAGFVFCPGVCVDLGMLRLNLFVYPRYHHYCFGDYYDDAYLRVGIYPWYKCQTVHTWYDPLFVYDRWHNERTDPGWAKRQAQEFQVRQKNHDLRPARTFAALQDQMTRLPAAKRPERALVQPVKSFATSQTTPVKFERINTEQRQQIATKSADLHSFRTQRGQWEAPTVQTAHSAPASSPHQQPTESKPTPAPTSNPHQPPAEFKPVPGPASKTAPASPSHGVSLGTAPEHAPIVPSVRVTRPEQVPVPNSAVSWKSSESHYIEKQAPGHPAQERSGSEPPANPRSQEKEPRK
jgi:hypothetical protein